MRIAGRRGEFQPHVAFRQRIFPQAGQFAEYGDVGIIFHGLPNLSGMARIAHIVQHDSGEPERGNKRHDPGHHGGGGAGHFRAVEGKEHGRVQRQRNLCGGTGSVDVPPVVQTPVAFNNCQIRFCAVRGKADSGAGQCCGQCAGGQEIRVKIRGGASGGQSQPCGINVIRPFFRGLNTVPPLPEGTGQTKGKQGFAAAAGKAGYDETGKVHAQRNTAKRGKPQQRAHSPFSCPCFRPASALLRKASLYKEEQHAAISGNYGSAGRACHLGLYVFGGGSGFFAA